MCRRTTGTAPPSWVRTPQPFLTSPCHSRALVAAHSSSCSHHRAPPAKRSPTTIASRHPASRHPASGNETAISLGVYSQSMPLVAYPHLKEHELPWSATAPLPLRIATFREYALALAALLPPQLGECLSAAAEFDCAVRGLCACFPDTVTGGRRADAARRAIRRWVVDRYAAIDDTRVVRGMGRAQCAAHRRFERDLVSSSPPPLSARDATWIGAHAHALRDKLRRLPHRGGEHYSHATWELEVANLVEDVAGAAVGAELALPLLEWVGGSSLGSAACTASSHMMHGQ